MLNRGENDLHHYEWMHGDALPAMQNQPARKPVVEPRPQDWKERMLEYLLLMIQEFPTSKYLNKRL